MKHISILVPVGETVLSSIVGPYKIFNAVNEYLIQTGKRDQNLFDIQLVGLNSGISLYGGLFQVNTSATIHDINKTDLIIIPALKGDIRKEIQNNYEYVDWIKHQYIVNNAEVASLCMGAFLLAETGLLNGKKCTTHWLGADEFRNMYKDIELMPDKVIIDDNGIYSSGGAYSFLNLMLYIVEKYCGKEVSLWITKVFEIEYDRNDQSHFTIFKGQKEHADEPIKKAQLFIENNFGEKISVEQLANTFAISRRNFVRRFKKATSNTPIEYIQRVKIEAAKKQLESTVENVNEIMFSVGYSDDKAFRNVFKRYTGMTPSEYKHKFSRIAI